jgi:hypothetical protein
VTVFEQPREGLRRRRLGAVVHQAHVAGVERHRPVERVEPEPVADRVGSVDLAGGGEEVVVDRLVDPHQVLGGEPDVEVGVDRRARSRPLDVVVHLVVGGRPLEFGIDARLELRFHPLAGAHRGGVDERLVGRDGQRRGGVPVLAVAPGVAVRRRRTTAGEPRRARRPAERQHAPSRVPSAGRVRLIGHYLVVSPGDQ